MRQVDRGEYFPVEPEEKGSYCEYWIHANFQTCLKLKESATKTNVFLIEGRFYERGEISLFARMRSQDLVAKFHDSLLNFILRSILPTKNILQSIL